MDTISFIHEQESDKFVEELVQDIDNFMPIDDQLTILELQKRARKIQKYGREKPSKKNIYDQIEEELNKLLNTDINTNYIVQGFDIGLLQNRINRYNIYDSIISAHRLVKRTLNLYKNNIFNKQHKITNKSDKKYPINIYCTDEKYKNIEIITKNIFKYFSLYEKIKEISCTKALKYGDSFIEIVNLKHIDNIINTKKKSSDSIVSLQYITENEKFNFNIDIPKTNNDYNSNDNTYGVITEDNNDINGQFKELFEERNLLYEDTEIDYNIFETLNYRELKNVHLRYLNPHNVIILEQDGILYGYLIIENSNLEKSGTMEIFSNRISESGYKSKNKNESISDIIDKLVQNILTNLTATFENKNKLVNELFLSDNFSKTLKIIIYKNLLNKQMNLNIRFVDPKSIVRFHTDINEYEPYGTSVIDNAVISANNELLSKNSSLISKIARTPVLRNWNIEIGNRKNEAELVQKFKQSLHSKNITFDDLNNVRNINRMLTAFTDVVTIQKNGRRFLDLEQIEIPTYQNRTDVDEILKEETIESLEVPRAYLGVNNQDILRESVVTANILFAVNIDAIQTLFENSISELISKIFNVILKNNGYNYEIDITKFVNIELNHPLILKVQTYEQMLNSISNIFNMIRQSGVDINPVTFFKQEMPYIDWDSLIKDSNIQNIETVLTQGQQNQEQ